jgi:hypothetical protein
LEQLDLLRASLFGNCTILRRNGIRINELLRRAGTEPRRKDQDHAELPGESSGRSTHRRGNLRGSHHCLKIIMASKKVGQLATDPVRHLNNTATVSHLQPASNFDRHQGGPAIISFRRDVRKATMVGIVV